MKEKHFFMGIIIYKKIQYSFKMKQKIMFTNLETNFFNMTKYFLTPCFPYLKENMLVGYTVFLLVETLTTSLHGPG